LGLPLGSNLGPLRYFIQHLSISCTWDSFQHVARPRNLKTPVSGATTEVAGDHVPHPGLHADHSELARTREALGHHLLFALPHQIDQHCIIGRD